MPSRIYLPADTPPNVGLTVGAPGDPVGDGAPLPCILTAGDGKLIRYAYERSTIRGTRWGIAYDDVIPPASTLNSIVVSADYATNSVLDDAPSVQIIEGNGEGFYATDFVELPIPANLSADPPTNDQWTTGSGTFTTVPLSLLNVGLLRTGALTYAFVTSRADDRLAQFFDRGAVTVNFTLAIPTGLTSPTYFNTRPNATGLVAQASVVAGTSNDAYPLTAWFEYTLSDPTARDFADLYTGVGAISSTTPITVPPTVSTDKIVHVTGEITGLSPSTTYYGRFVMKTADEQYAHSTWSSFTTTQFDRVSSF